MEYRFFSEEELGEDDIELVYSWIDPQLKQTLMVESNRRFLLNCPLLHQNFSSEFLKRLSLSMERRRYVDKEIIFEEGTLP